MRDWSDAALAPAVCRYSPLAGDASFRRYFRIECDDKRNFVLMDAPPDKEDPMSFSEITARLLGCGVRAPRIHHADLARGFLLIDDFGDELYLKQLSSDCVSPDNVEALYRAAIDTLIKIQQADSQGLPAFDRDTMMEEMHLFTDWLLDKHLDMRPDVQTQEVYENAFHTLVENALAQPQTFVHRDYHSRNLMVLKDGGSPGVLDYQDAVVGPISYDLVSLLKDCYIKWPQENITHWRDYFLECHRGGGDDFDDDDFERWFDLMGMQRHFKASGIFARLYHRDDKRDYLADIPRTLGYIAECASRYREFIELGNALEKVIKRLPTEQR